MNEQEMLEHVLQRKLALAHGDDAASVKTLLAYVGLSVLEQQKKAGVGVLELQKMTADMLEAEAVRKVQAKFQSQRRRTGEKTPLAPKVTEVVPVMLPPPTPAPDQFRASSVFA